MKKYSILLLISAFAVTMFTGCGCRNSKPAETTAPTTQATTIPTTSTTEPSPSDTTHSTDMTIEDGNGPLPTNATAGEDGDTSAATTDAAENRNRSAVDNMSPTTGIDGRTHRMIPEK